MGACALTIAGAASVPAAAAAPEPDALQRRRGGLRGFSPTGLGSSASDIVVSLLLMDVVASGSRYRTFSVVGSHSAMSGKIMSSAMVTTMMMKNGMIDR